MSTRHAKIVRRCKAAMEISRTYENAVNLQKAEQRLDEWRQENIRLVTRDDQHRQ